MSSFVSAMLFVPLIFQAMLMIFDEFYFHRRRGLPKWEIIGHPLDTLTVIAPLVLARSANFTDKNAFLYVALSTFSCIFIVKDELIHKNICSKAEMILHALLFILHPLVFLSIFLFWQNGETNLLGLTIDFNKIVTLQLIVTCMFCLYQIFYWRFFYERPRNKQRHI
jgi:hypothetical protein